MMFGSVGVYEMARLASESPAHARSAPGVERDEQQERRGRKRDPHLRDEGSRVDVNW